jgi:hypothetical protein
VRGHLLRDFELPAVLQIRGDAAGAKRVAADQGLGCRPPRRGTGS